MNEKAKKSKKAESRTRNFATIVYPESAPSEWLSILDAEHIPTFVSPLHDRDTNQTPEKELKKAHYHVIVMFSSVKTEKQAREVFDKIGGVGCEAVKSIRGHVRYLCHLDNPDKAKYSESDVICLNGADYYSIVKLASDKYSAIKEMLAWCRANDIISYSDLFEYAMDERDDWFRCLCDSSTLVVKEYLRSYAWSRTMKK